MNSQVSAALNQYQTTGNSSLYYASPHQLILRLLNGAMDRIAQAKGAMKQGNARQKGEMISKAIGIVNGLNGCLDHSQEGDLSQNLAALYDYINLALLQANVENNVSRLDEASRLLQEIRAGWLQIAGE